MRARRGTTNRNARGSSTARRARRIFLLRKFGDGMECRCYRCKAILNITNITVDRILPGCRGGTYERGNIRPACGPCNSETGGALRRRAA